jgi:hypothetical protein
MTIGSSDITGPNALPANGLSIDRTRPIDDEFLGPRRDRARGTEKIDLYDLATLSEIVPNGRRLQGTSPPGEEWFAELNVTEIRLGDSLSSDKC